MISLGKRAAKNCIWVVDTHFLGPTQKLLLLVVLQLGDCHPCHPLGAQFAPKKRCFKTTRAVFTVFSCIMLCNICNSYIYIYINMNIRIYHESICIYTSCAQSVYLICHCQLLRWLLRQGPTSAFNSTGSQLQHRQWRISRWSLWRFSSVGSAQQKPTPKLQRWTATV